MGGILPWLIGGAVALYYFHSKSQSDAAGTTTTASNGTSVTLPGLTIAPSIQPLTSDDVAVARSVLDGSFVVSGRRIDSYTEGNTAAKRLVALQQVLDEWAQVGRSPSAPDLRTVLTLG